MFACFSFKRQVLPRSMSFSSSLVLFLNLLRRTILSSLLLSLIWLLGLPINPAFADAAVSVAMPKIVSQSVVDAAEGDRLSTLLTCLPKQLSQPSFARAWSEMGNDQLERAFNLKASPKLSEAEIELKQCLNRKVLTN